MTDMPDKATRIRKMIADWDASGAIKTSAYWRLQSMLAQSAPAARISLAEGAAGSLPAAAFTVEERPEAAGEVPPPPTEGRAQ